MSNTPLIISNVPRSLEVKSKIFGFEISDVLLIFLNLSLQNLIFGTTSLKYLMVWGSTLFLSLLLLFVKRGKPDKYLQHLFQYISSPSVRYANLNDRKYRKFQKSKMERII